MYYPIKFISQVLLFLSIARKMNSLISIDNRVVIINRSVESISVSKNVSTRLIKKIIYYVST